MSSYNFNNRLFKILSFRLFIKSEGFFFFFGPKTQFNIELLKNYLIFKKIDFKLY
jgi:hypothetical protein